MLFAKENKTKTSQTNKKSQGNISFNIYKTVYHGYHGKSVSK